MPSSSNNVVTAGRTYLDLITSTPAKPQNALPARPKTKRERADENWKILDGIIKESEQFPKGSEQRAKCLERLHEVLRRISKRPKGMPAKPQMFDSAADEWEDFLAPTCSMCGLATDNNACKCDELAKNAEAFLAPEDAASSSASSDTTLQDGDQDDVFPQKMSP